MANRTLVAKWSYSLSFDTSSEPGDADYPGDAKDDLPVTSDDGQVDIEPPTRPGYVFQGWVVDGKPNDEGLLTEGADGTWSVDASKLPEYADGNGKVSLTARWTAAISVDAPISATFMYDLSAWDGTESRDAMTIEGSSTVKNRSAVPIRVSGLESSKGTAANVLKKDDGTTLADAEKGDPAKVLSVFPTTSDATGTESDAKGGATDDAGDDLAHKVDLALSEVKLEEAFDADAWAIPAGASANGAVTVPGEVKLGYRLNLGSSTGVTLDKDALLAATGDPEAGSSSKAASIADLTYCFALEALVPTGTLSDPFYVVVDEGFIEENGLEGAASPGVYGLDDIRAASADISSRVTAVPPSAPGGVSEGELDAYWEAVQEQAAGSPYYPLCRALLDAQVMRTTQAEADAGTISFGAGPYFMLQVAGATSGYLPVQLIGIAQDDRSDAVGKAGLTFQLRDVYARDGVCSGSAGGGSFANAMDPSFAGSGVRGWQAMPLREALRGDFASRLPARVSAAIVPVWKAHQLAGGTDAAHLQRTSGETLWQPSVYEVLGQGVAGYAESEALSGAIGSPPFQYQAFQGDGGATSVLRAAKALNNGRMSTYWTRSAYRPDDRYYCCINGGSYGFNGANNPDGVCPGFCL